MKKIIKKLLVIVVIMISNFALLVNTVKAVDVEVYAKETFDKIIKFNGILVNTIYIVHQENGIEYPAYCLNVDLPGAEEGAYNTTNEGKITDVGLWRVIINGYPYKTIEELGVANLQEAYIATKQSIYCYLYNRGTEKYSAVGEAGQRTINAMNQILENAKNSTETLENFLVSIKDEKNWKEDEINSEYMSKTYEVISDANINKYSLNLENISKEILITDMENNLKTEFDSGEKFKILIPKNIKEVINFNINVIAELETKPVFYGKAPNENLQDCALTTYSYEDIKGELNQEYIPPQEPEIPEEPEIPNEPEIHTEPEVPIEETPQEEIKKLPVTGM